MRAKVSLLKIFLAGFLSERVRTFCESFTSSERSSRIPGATDKFLCARGVGAETGLKWFRNGVTCHHDRLASPQHRFAPASAHAAAALRCVRRPGSVEAVPAKGLVRAFTVRVPGLLVQVRRVGEVVD